MRKKGEFEMNFGFDFVVNVVIIIALYHLIINAITKLLKCWLESADNMVELEDIDCK